MLKKISLLIALFVTTISFVLAQDNPVHFKLSSKKVTDCEYDLQFVASIDEPWHMYSLSPVKNGPNVPCPSSIGIDGLPSAFVTNHLKPTSGCPLSIAN